MQTNQALLLLLVTTALIGYTKADSYCVCPPFPSFSDNNNLDLFTKGANMFDFMKKVHNYATTLPGMLHQVNKSRRRRLDVSPKGLEKLKTTRARESAVAEDFTNQLFNKAIETMELEELYFNRDELQTQFNIPGSKSFDGHDVENATSGQFEHHKFYSFRLNMKVADIKGYYANLKRDDPKAKYGMRWDNTPETTAKLRFLVLVKQFRDHRMSGYKLSFFISRAFINAYTENFDKNKTGNYSPVHPSLMDKNHFRSLTSGHEVVISKYHGNFIEATICNNFMIFYSKVLKMFTSIAFSGRIQERKDGCDSIKAVNTEVVEEEFSLNSFYPAIANIDLDSPLYQFDQDTIEEMNKTVLNTYNQTPKTITTIVKVPEIPFDIFYIYEFSYLYIYILIYKYQPVYDGIFLQFKKPNHENKFNFYQVNDQAQFFLDTDLFKRIFDALRIFMRYFYHETAMEHSALIIDVENDFGNQPPEWYIVLSNIASSLFLYEKHIRDNDGATLWLDYQEDINYCLSLLKQIREINEQFDYLVNEFASKYGIQQKHQENYYISLVTLTHYILDFLYWDHSKGIFYTDLLELRRLWYSIMTSSSEGVLPPDYVYSLEFLDEPIGEAYDTENEEIKNLDLIEIQKMKKQSMLVEVTKRQNDVRIEPINPDLVEPRNTITSFTREIEENVIQTGDNTMLIRGNGGKEFKITELNIIEERSNDESPDNQSTESQKMEKIFQTYNLEEDYDSRDNVNVKTKNQNRQLRNGLDFNATSFLKLTKGNLDFTSEMDVHDGKILLRNVDEDIKTYVQEIEDVHHIVSDQSQKHNITIKPSEINFAPFEFEVAKIDVSQRNSHVVQKIINQNDKEQEEYLNSELLKMTKENSENIRRAREMEDQINLIEQQKGNINKQLMEQKQLRIREQENLNNTKQKLHDEIKQKEEYAQTIKDLEEENIRVAEQLKRDAEIAKEIQRNIIIEEERKKFKIRETVERDLHSKTKGRSKILDEIQEYVEEEWTYKSQPFQAMGQFPGTHVERLLRLIFFDKFNTDLNLSWGDLEYPLDPRFIEGLHQLESISPNNRDVWNQIMIQMIGLSVVLKRNPFDQYSAEDINETWMSSSNNLLYEFHKSRKYQKGLLEEPVMRNGWENKVQHVILQARYRIADAIRDFFFFASNTGLDFKTRKKNVSRVPIFEDFRIRVDKDYRVLYEVTLNQTFVDAHRDEPDFDAEQFILREILIVIFSVKQEPLSEKKMEINLSVEGENVTMERDMRDMFAQLCQYKPFLDEATELAKKNKRNRELEALEVIHNETNMNIRLENKTDDLIKNVDIQLQRRNEKNSKIEENNIRFVKEHELNPGRQAKKIQEVHAQFQTIKAYDKEKSDHQKSRIMTMQQVRVNSDQTLLQKENKRIAVIQTLDQDINSNQTGKSSRMRLNVTSKKADVIQGFRSDEQQKNNFHSNVSTNFNFGMGITNPDKLNQVQDVKIYDANTFTSHSIRDQNNVVRQEKVTFKGNLRKDDAQIGNYSSINTVVQEPNDKTLQQFSGVVIGNVSDFSFKGTKNKMDVSITNKSVRSEFGNGIQNLESKAGTVYNPSNVSQTTLYQEKSTVGSGSKIRGGFQYRRRALVII